MAISSNTSAHLCAEAVTLALRRAGSAKEVGRLVGRSPRTVERWRRAEAKPGADVLVRLMARSRAAAETILAAAGLTERWPDSEDGHPRAEPTAPRARRHIET